MSLFFFWFPLNEKKEIGEIITNNVLPLGLHVLYLSTFERSNWVLKLDYGVHSRWVIRNLECDSII